MFFYQSAYCLLDIPAQNSSAFLIFFSFIFILFFFYKSFVVVLMFGFNCFSHAAAHCSYMDTLFMKRSIPSHHYSLKTKHTQMKTQSLFSVNWFVLFLVLHLSTLPVQPNEFRFFLSFCPFLFSVFLLFSEFFVFFNYYYSFGFKLEPNLFLSS